MTAPGRCRKASRNAELVSILRGPAGAALKPEPNNVTSPMPTTALPTFPQCAARDAIELSQLKAKQCATVACSRRPYGRLLAKRPLIAGAAAPPALEKLQGSLLRKALAWPMDRQHRPG